MMKAIVSFSRISIGILLLITILNIQNNFSTTYLDTLLNQNSVYAQEIYDSRHIKINNKDTNSKQIVEIERFDDKLFVCDNGIVVDDRTQCPLKCPFGTTLDGAYVMDLDVCNVESTALAQECGPDTDMPGVLAMNQDQCTIFATCDADSPLGSALNTLEPLKVADVQLCQLNIPGMAICDSGFLEGFVVDDESVCDTALNDVSVCGPTADVAGMLTANPESCNLFTTCDANSNLGTALGNTPITVVDPELM